MLRAWRSRLLPTPAPLIGAPARCLSKPTAPCRRQRPSPWRSPQAGARGAVPVSIGCSVAFKEAPRARTVLTRSCRSPIERAALSPDTKSTAAPAPAPEKVFGGHSTAASKSWLYYLGAGIAVGALWSSSSCLPPAGTGLRGSPGATAPVVSLLGITRLGAAFGTCVTPLGILLLAPSAAGCGGFATSSRGVCA
jgi:hypothetical protein